MAQRRRVIELFVVNFQIFLLVMFRIVAMVEVAPLLSSSAIPQIAKIGLSLFIAAAVFPLVMDLGYVLPDDPVHYFMLIIGEVLIGIIIGFMLVMVFAIFQMAGQFFSLQMGFGASEVFDPLAQIEVPLMGQFLNIVGMFVFLTLSGFARFTLVGVFRSFQAVRAVDLVAHRNELFTLFASALTDLFASALTVSFPILGTLFLVSVSMGLMAKAAPQMNILMMGFPVAIGVAFLMIFLTIPYLMGAFARLIDSAFDGILQLYADIGRGGG
jgi:flagellar biosynthetic protein FliR